MEDSHILTTLAPRLSTQFMKKRFFIIFTALCGTISTLLAEMPRDYYPNTLEGLNGAELKTALHNLIKEHRRIAYGSRDEDGACTWTVFKQSDRHPDGRVWDMYSNNSRYFSSGATKGMNIEHSVPKSWWGDDYPYQYDASYDLHHLVPADADANSAKSNYPLGVVISTSFDNGVSKIGSGYVNGKTNNVFEPANEYKGDFARMYLYIVTCYQDYSWTSSAPTMFNSNDYPTLNSYGQSLLLEWHRNDPVSQKEIDRNNAVYEFQENRNPYIDYPFLVEFLWGKWMGEDFSFSGVPLSNPKLTVSKSEIDFGYMAENSSKELQIYLKGRKLTGEVTAQWLDNNQQEFSVYAPTWSADEINLNGINITITFAPYQTGRSEATLRLTNSALENPVDINVSGTVLSSNITFPVIVEVESSYRKSHGDVPLKLNIDGLNPQWTIDGTIATQLSPSALSTGMHTIEFTTSTGVKGKMRIKIID